MSTPDTDSQAAARRPAWVLPPGWSVLGTESWGPFVVRQLVRRPDGAVVELTGRRHRKQLPPRLQGGPSLRPTALLWSPSTVGWWVGVLFIVGSACFAVGSVPGYVAATSVAVDAVTYFVGSLFFTSAAYLQFHQAAHASDPEPAPVPRARWVRARSLGWWASSVQLVGTLFFNATTFAALHTGFTVRQEDFRVWSPDFFGSVCFLVASWFAVEEVRLPGRPWRQRWADIGWRVAWLNMWGSVFFMASAIAAFVLPDTGDLVSASVANSGTFLGAVCFLVGAWLLLVELGPTEAETT
ncbi:MAG TPA: hypothetical protein VMI11_15515 [Actinomycetes bacterium]|nr:hypothetical protein [Actinomycetes bacterium]